MRLKDKVAVITGAALGIGRAIAFAYAKEGATLVLGDIAGEELEKTVAALRSDGVAVKSVIGNIAQKVDAEKLIDAALEAHGKIDILVNNAGVLDGLTPLLDASDELYDRVLGVNLQGPFFTCRKAVSHMLTQGSGTIVNLASLAGVHGGRGGTLYTMSKHAVVGLTKSIAFYYGDAGIRANVICPGGIDTEIHKRSTINETGLKKASQHFKTTPRPGKTDEIAACAVFLASPEASYVNGATLVVDGGWTAH